MFIANEGKRLTKEEIIAEIRDHQHYLAKDVKYWEAMRADFSDRNLSLVDFPAIVSDLSTENKPVDLTGAIFNGANLSQTNLSHMKLDECNFVCADLSDANLSDTSCHDCDFTGAIATEADFSGAELVYCLCSRADLTHANFDGALIEQSSFVSANLSNVRSVTRMTNCNCAHAFLCGADLKGCNLYGTNLYGARMEHANLSNTIMVDGEAGGAQLCGADLNHARFVNVNFLLADFSCADLSESTLETCFLSNTNLQWVNLSRAVMDRSDLSNANLYGAVMDHASVKFTHFDETSFTGLKDLSGTDFNKADIRSIALDGHTIDKDTLLLLTRKSFSEEES